MFLPANSDTRATGEPAPSPLPPSGKWYKEFYRFYTIVGMAGVKDLSSEKASMFDISATFGFQYRRAVAFGLGVEFLNDKTNAYSHLPIYFEFRSHFSPRRTSPYSVLKVGYSIPAGGTRKDAQGMLRVNKSGIMLGADLGYRMHINENFAGTVFIGYQAQMFQVERLVNPTAELPAGSYINPDQVLLHMIKFGVTLNIGFGF
ncbi:MAG: hypothetical protein J5605_01170 [Bacteroidales bacterium]|nr:hypothetical protein [Bacteroidales bacterium]